VNFTEQEKYLKRSRVWSAACACCTIAAAAYTWKHSGITSRMPVIIFAVVIGALVGSLFYTPDYLHLSVNRTKGFRWQIKIRWRLIAAGLVIGLLCASNVREVEIVLMSCAWLVVANLFAKRAASPRLAPLHFWLTDLALLGTLLWNTRPNALLVIALLAASNHVLIVTIENSSLLVSAVFAFSTSQLIFSVGGLGYFGWRSSLAFAAVVAVSILATGILVARAKNRNAKNSVVAMRELTEFTAYSEEKIRELWATSNQQLAKNWKDAHLDESDREKMTAWYRENSELYMFAISGYNLEYKRIRDSIKMLRYGRGACLDYGAGNGEIILELARHGHAAVYFDVDGTSMRFARQRAERQKLAVEFFHSKDDLATSAKKRGLDTIFSFDVLEHLPDLPGELKFLASLLNPGGRMAFDVPAGSTKAHPMHLNHHLDVHAHMASIGMVEERGLLQSIPFRKQEKYVFRKPA
jgi:2-polyprenyl-3-methyl-5-hydroxy-6-metoxy-1,4-benzoquinol methylase